jgi:thiol:disulfide interchange protein
LTAWLLALIGAFIGGILLNLMPCVFPVLALKVLTFAESSAADTRSHRLNGLGYTAGVVLSFALLGAALLALRNAGDLLGWGFQLQNPWLVGALSVFFTLIALNLLGIFEVGNWLPQGLANARAKNPTTDAFLSGVLATAVASPCTAPFMGASLGLAIALPTAQGLGVFMAVGLGMASPYLLASWVPAVAHWLPRPGAWMVAFKQLMAFPMMATVVWLLWVFGQQTSLNSAAALLLWLLGIAWLLWSWAQSGSPTARLIWRGIGIMVFAAFTWLLSNPLVHSDNETGTSATAAATGGTDLLGTAALPGTWLPWSAAQVTQSLAAGQPVFVDFTAAWCVTCQVNKATTLTTQAVREAFNAKGVITLQADWTRRNPDITAALNALGRNGVPTYALYAPGAAPVVLSELITPDEVNRVLAALPDTKARQNP